MPIAPGTILRNLLDNRDKGKKDEANFFQAKLIRRDGKVQVSGRPQWVNYLPLFGRQPGIAYNLGRVVEQEDVQVIIGFPPDSKTPCVISKDPDFMQDNSQTGPMFASHGQDHRYMGVDPSPVDLRSLQALMIMPAGGFSVQILSGRYNAYGEERYFGGDTIDLTADQPATLGKAGVGLYLDIDNSLQSVAGSIVTDVPGMSISPPGYPEGVFKLGLVILYADKNFIDKEDLANRKIIWNEPGPNLLTIEVFS